MVSCGFSHTDVYYDTVFLDFAGYPLEHIRYVPFLCTDPVKSPLCSITNSFQIGWKFPLLEYMEQVPGQIVRQAHKQHPQTTFSEVLEWKTHMEWPISALKIVWEFILAMPKVSDVENADTLGKFTTAWPSPGPRRLWVWRASTWFSLNHLPAGHHALAKACYGRYKLTRYHTPAITGRQLHPSAATSPCTVCGLGEIELKYCRGGKSTGLDAKYCIVYWCGCDHRCCRSEPTYQEIQQGTHVYVLVNWCTLHLSHTVIFVVQVTGGGSESLCQNNVIECQWACRFPQRK